VENKPERGTEKASEYLKPLGAGCGVENAPHLPWQLAARQFQRRTFLVPPCFCLCCKNSFTAWRTIAETGAIDFLDSFVNARTCCAVSQTTVLFMAAGWFVVKRRSFPRV